MTEVVGDRVWFLDSPRAEGAPQSADTDETEDHAGALAETEVTSEESEEM